MNILAKTNPEIGIYEHLNNVAETSAMMCRKGSDDIDIEALSYVCGLLHDIGKGTESFQKHLTDTEEAYTLHNVAGYLLFNKLCGGLSINGADYKELISNVILYHHPTNYNEDTKDFSVTENDINIVRDIISTQLSKFKETYKEKGVIVNYSIRKEDAEDIIDSIGIPSKPVFLSKNEALTFLVRTIVNASDIFSSHYEKDNSHTIEYYFNIELNRCGIINLPFHRPFNYDWRFDKQLEFATKLIETNSPISLFDSQTGFGKTMLGLIYLLKNTNKRGYWVCPQNSICNVYYTIKRELKNLGLDNFVSVGLLLTGVFVEGNEKSDIIVTNIDNMFKPVLKSDKDILYRSFQLLYGNCIFDEYHEYVSESAIMAAFSLVCKARKLWCSKKNDNSRMLLLSATSVPYFTNKYIKNENAEIYYDNEEMLNRKMHITFKDTFDSYVKGQNYFYCVNSVKNAQRIMLNGYVDNIIHAQFLDSYKKKRYEELFTTHGKGKNDNSSWVSTSVSSTGIDISFKNGVFVKMTPEKAIQSMGRINRWGECDSIPNVILVKDEMNKSEICALRTISRNTSNTVSFDTISNDFFDFLKNRFGNEATVTNRELYQARKDFYKENEEKIETFYKKLERESDRNLSLINYSYANNRNDKTDVQYISNKPNLRTNGKNEKYFVKLKDDTTGEWIDELYQMEGRDFENFDDSFWSDALSLSNIKKFAKRNIGRTVKIKERLLNDAISSEKPLMMVRNIFHNSVLGVIKIK